MVAIVTRLIAGRSEFPIPAGARDVCLVPILRPGSGAHSAYHSVGIIFFFTGVNRSECDVDRPLPSNTEV